MMEQFEELTDKIDMLQYYVEHLGRRIDILMKMMRSGEDMAGPPPRPDSARKARLMSLLME